MTDSDEQVGGGANWDELVALCGIMSDLRVTSVQTGGSSVNCSIGNSRVLRNFKVTPDLIELRNSWRLVAELIIRCAMLRRESRIALSSIIRRKLPVAKILSGTRTSASLNAPGTFEQGF